MPLTPIYELTVAQLPPIPVPTTIFDPNSVNPETQGRGWEYINFGEIMSGWEKNNRNDFIRTTMLSRYGGGAWAVVSGLDLQDVSGLNAQITPGSYILDHPNTLSANEPLALTDSIDKVFTWLQYTGDPTMKNDDPTLPGTDSIYLGRFKTTGGGITKVDYAGRWFWRNGSLWRRTGDLTKPTDTPSSLLNFFHQSVDGVYFWTGTEYLPVYSRTGLRATKSSVSIAGGAGTSTLSQAQYDASIIYLTGALTGNRNVVVPDTGLWLFENDTTGAFTTTIKTAGGTGVVLGQGGRMFLQADGTNVVPASFEFGHSSAHAYTSAYATLSRALAAYTTDAESSAYTGAADGEAKLADLNSLRVAYENLRAGHDNLLAVVNQMIKDMQTDKIFG